jgi:hypothetical protein
MTETFKIGVNVVRETESTVFVLIRADSRAEAERRAQKIVRQACNQYHPFEHNPFDDIYEHTYSCSGIDYELDPEEYDMDFDVSEEPTEAESKVILNQLKLLSEEL